jgi:AcrR family transcriptional regulator
MAYTGKKRKYENVIACLLSTNTIAEAASAAGISEGTIYNYLRNAEFQKQYREVKQQVVSQAASSIATMTRPAIDEMFHLLLNAKSDNTRLKAAELIINYSLQLVTLDEIENRIEQLEERRMA